MTLHVNRGNLAALRFYRARGYRVVDDWLGHDSARFLLFKPAAEVGGVSDAAAVEPGLCESVPPQPDDVCIV